MANNENNEFINPLDVRTEDEHKKRLKEWENFGLLNPDIMDYLTGLSEEGIDAVRSLLILSGKDPITINDNINNYMMIEGLVKGELEFAYDDDGTDDPDAGSNSEDGEWED